MVYIFFSIFKYYYFICFLSEHGKRGRFSEASHEGMGEQDVYPLCGTNQ